MEYLHVNEFSRTRGSGKRGESGLLTQEYGYFHMLYREGGKKAVHNHAS